MLWGARVGHTCSAGMAAACTSCTGQSLYTTPRTLNADDVQVILAPEYVTRTRTAKPGPPSIDPIYDSPPPRELGRRTRWSSDRRW